MAANQQDRILGPLKSRKDIVEILDWPRLAFHQASNNFATRTFESLYGALRSCIPCGVTFPLRIADAVSLLSFAFRFERVFNETV
jgi:hypothetical protein